MRFITSILLFLLIIGSVSAECRNKSCMTNEFIFVEEENSTGHVFYYDEVFNIGSNWYIIFDYPEANTNTTISFEFDSGVSKIHSYDNALVTDSISFSGSSFSEENLNMNLKIIIEGEEGMKNGFNLSIDINKPPADDLFYLWGGMTVFWLSIGAYVIYMSTKLTRLRVK